MWGNRGKTPGKQVQHASACGTAAAEIRHFLAVEPGLTRFRSVFARGFAPVTMWAAKPRRPQGLQAARDAQNAAAEIRIRAL